MKRIYHPWTAWECVPAGMYETVAPPPMSSDDAVRHYAMFLRDTPRFQAALTRVIGEWPISCEQFLSNEHINRVAWLGQSSMCIATGVPACFRRGFMLLSDSERQIANQTAQACLTEWLRQHGERDVVASMAGDDGIDRTAFKDSGTTQQRVSRYRASWMRRGYPDDLPDEVPPELMHQRLAPSYKAIAIAILKNDLKFHSLGFAVTNSPWYMAIKRVEIAARPAVVERVPIFPRVALAIPQPKPRLRQLTLWG